MSRKKNWQLELGACPDGKGHTRFTVWAPRVRRMKVRLFQKKGYEDYPMPRDSQGYFQIQVNNAPPGTRYFYLLNDEKKRPDPVSRYQPEGVHGPSMVIDPNQFKWRDSRWKGIELKDMIFYELHVGTFTKKGTFEAVIPKIPYLKKLGVTCIELMPVTPNFLR